MALLNDILQWTTTLPLWQRDAARRLLHSGQGLSEGDYRELCALLKAENGLQEIDGLKPEPLRADHLPTEPRAGETVILKAMRELMNVNRIPPDQTLRFSDKGITIVFGDNSTGKSGYARVLKHACRSRDQSEQVHPNAYDPSAADITPTAKLEIELDGVAQEICWSRDDLSPEVLSAISVFDCRCARSYLTDEHDVAYLPYGLDIVEDLANMVLPELKRRLDEEIANVDVDVRPFDHLRGPTDVGTQIERLGPNSDPSAIKALGTLTGDEQKRLQDLTKALGDADPAGKAKQHRLSASRLKSLGERVLASLSAVSQEAIDILEELDEATIKAEEAERKAAKGLRAGERLLPGTGEEVWKLMFDAAKKFSTEVAYPGLGFPPKVDDAVCPLCQEKLNNTTTQRLARFEQYFRDDVAKTTQEKRKKLESAKANLTRHDLSVGLDSSLSEEIRLLDETAPSLIISFEDCLEKRRESILKSLSSHDWSDIIELVENPRKRIRDLAARQLLTSRTFARAADVQKKKELAAELAALVARQDLSKNLVSVLALLQRMKDKDALEKCYTQLKTRPISDKSREFASSAITGDLKSALDRELRSLGVGHIQTKLKSRVDRGRMLYQLLLDLPSTKRIDEILSEGEQRAIAIAAFMAELSMASHSCGIVLDDPVSSLDHWRRRDAVRRLVEEASRRQVIIFTHDTVFLGQLCDEIDVGNVPHAMLFLEWRANCPGYVCDGLPWDHQGYKARIDALEKDQRKLARNWPTYPGKKEAEQIGYQYDRLRATLERVVQDVVFNGVVKRYRDWIRFDSLAEVVGFEQSEYEAIDTLHRRCCDVVPAHDHASAKSQPVPTARELGEDIEALKRLVQAIKDRRKARS